MKQHLNYGVIGNCSTAALISNRGSIDWLCLPEFDSASVFAALLDKEKGGHFGFDVTDIYHSSQFYVPHTNILTTRFTSSEGTFDVVDFMPLYQLPGEKRYYRPAEIYRYIKKVEGKPRFRVGYQPAPDYARGKPFLIKPYNILKPTPLPTVGIDSISIPLYPCV